VRYRQKQSGKLIQRIARGERLGVMRPGSGPSEEQGHRIIPWVRPIGIGVDPVTCRPRVELKLSG
jgi:hypothetical protein